MKKAKTSTKEKQIFEQEMDEICSRSATTKFDLDNHTLRLIEKNISDFIGSDFKPVKKTYSSEGMNQLQNLIYLVEEADKQFPKDERVIANIIYDELLDYSFSQGIATLTSIVQKFVNCHDTSGRFNYKREAI